MNRKAVVVTCFESNEERARMVYEVLKDKDFAAEVITSDFSHIRKVRRENIPSEMIVIQTKPYARNLSLERMLSHKQFARKAFCMIEEKKPDLIYLMTPANSFIPEAERYKKANPSVRIIIDMIDMWPESLPLSIDKNLFPLNLWRNIRSHHIGCADFLITECSLYQEILKKEYPGKMQTIYWSRDAHSSRKEIEVPKDRISLCYIGSINNIIDIDRITSIVKEADLPVVMHIIGDGENKDRMITALKDICEVNYYGEIRDEEKKSEIFRKCHAGINIYKEKLYIGLTVKCIDYFLNGLPIINNIKGDTWKLVESYHAGINIDRNTRIRYEDLLKLRMNNQNIYDVFENNFSKENFTKKVSQVIDEVLP